MIRRGEIYWVQLDPTVGAEIQKTRPCLVVSNNRANRLSQIIAIVPITSVMPAKIYPFQVAIAAGVGGLKKAGLVKVNQIKSVDKQRLSGDALGALVDEATMDHVAKAIKIHLDIN